MVIVALVVIVLESGLAYRQIHLGDTYREQELQQNFRRILIPGPRGDILDRDGRLLVGNRPLFSAVVYLNELRPAFREEYLTLVRQARDSGENVDRNQLQVKARQRVVQGYMDQVNAVLQREESVENRRIERHFAQNLLLPLPLIHDLQAEEYARLIEQIPVDSPVQVITDYARHYPHGHAAAHALGFVTATDDVSDEGVPGADLTTFRFKGKAGRSGVERAFEDHLQGTAGGEIWVVDPSGFQYRRTDHRPPVKGNDLYTSLDLDLQWAAEDRLDRYTGTVIALDIRTGEVLAIASRPAFDLNDLSPFLSNRVDREIRESGGWLNRAIQGLYPPGSTFKLVTAIAGQRLGHITPETEVDCPGYHVVGNRRFQCHIRTGHGTVDLVEAISASCNVFFYQKGLEAGVDAISREARNFGFDAPTGIELPGESRRPNVPDRDWKSQNRNERWFPGDTANLSIGQGFLLVTPLQMASFTASLARGETRTVPTLRRVGNPDSIDHRGEAIALSPEDQFQIIAGMERSTMDGTSRPVAIPGVRIAGKTGTAQVRPGGQPLTLAWFVGFAPVDDPRIAIAVMIEGSDPHDNYHGGSTAAPIARAVFEAYFNKHGHLRHTTAGP